MIIRLRSALICETVRGRGGQTDLLGIAGVELLAYNKPGLLDCFLTAQLELDRQPTFGRVRVSCTGLEKDFPFAVPAGHPHAGLAFPLKIPVVSQGELVVILFDDSQSDAEPRRICWSLGFVPRAEPTDLDGAAIQAACQAFADTVANKMVN
ncbi:MAG: hypothetical protein B7Z12_15565 [Caulobacter vibrioides]|uniref:Uncharacterized protein n=1 Tax=Caulobacter vibrioides TaxID=155892 RepID=A0A258CZ69_CAUVI|nr:MAG: hypothetical protein B7Z12_15565 [Caulobacter vibrioides]